MRIRPGLAALAATTLLLAACGDDSGTATGSGEDTEEAAPQSQPTLVPEPATVWVSSPDTQELYEIDVATRTVASEVPVDGYITQSAFHDGAMWVAAGALYRMDPSSRMIEQRSPDEQEVASFAWDGDRLWASEGDDGASVYELDPETGEVLDTVEIPGEDVDPEDLVPYGDHMLALNTYDHTIMSIDLETGEFESVGHNDSIVWDLALVNDVLHASTYDGFLTLDPETLETTAEVDEEAAFASDPDEDGVLWLGRSGELGRFDPEAGQYEVVSAEVPGGEGGKVDDLKVSEDSVWMVFDTHVLVRHDRTTGQFDPPIPLPEGAGGVPVYGIALQQ
jgi:WD40 repeat protein